MKNATKAIESEWEHNHIMLSFAAPRGGTSFSGIGYVKVGFSQMINCHNFRFLKGHRYKLFKWKVYKKDAKIGFGCLQKELKTMVLSHTPPPPPPKIYQVLIFTLVYLFLYFLAKCTNEFIFSTCCGIYSQFACNQ